jgi:hypothetical protein
MRTKEFIQFRFFVTPKVFLILNVKNMYFIYNSTAFFVGIMLNRSIAVLKRGSNPSFSLTDGSSDVTLCCGRPHLKVSIK